MENLFDVIGNRMFSVFASKDRRANYELLLFIYDTFTQDECSQAIEKGELVDKFAEYIKQHSFNEFDDDDGVDILAKTAKEKSNFKLRQFKRCGWLEEDNSEGFYVFVSMTDNAIALMETFKNLISKRNRPLEYTGYFYVIYETLRNFDYQKSKALIEQVVKNTTELFNHLQGLHSTIKDYISKLMVRKDLKPQDVLDLLLNKYQNQVVLTVFNNLKGRDNPSKYTSEILSKLRELRYEKLREVTENYAITAGLKDPTEDQYSEIESDLRNDLDYVTDRFESVDELISIIDRKNSRFHRSALSTINFLMNNRNDINGKIDKVLRTLATVEADDFSDAIPIFGMRTLDEKSPYVRAFNKKQVTSVVSRIPEVSAEEIEANFERIFAEDALSKEKINEYVEELLKDRNFVEVKDLDFSDQETFFKVILIEIYAEYEGMSYSLNYHEGTDCIDGYHMQTFQITRRGM